MTATLERPPAGPSAGRGSGGRSRILRLWSWRLFRREWRQQILVVALLTLAVAATVVAGAAATNGPRAPSTTLVISAPGAGLEADLDALRNQFGRISYVESVDVPIPGSVDKLSLRAESPIGTFGSSSLQLLSGAWPVGSDQVAVSPSAATDLNLPLGATFVYNGHPRTVVATVRNGGDYSDEFALVAPGQLPAPSTLLVAIPYTSAHIEFPPGSPLYGKGVQVDSTTTRSRATDNMIVLLMSTLALSFVGLIATAGFAVMAQRRMRALGMLAAVGATDRQVRSVMLANGVIVGVVSSGVGLAVGVLAWLAVAPHLAGWVGHSIDRWGLPWWTIGGAGLLASATALLAAWWPAQRVARIPIVSALSGRPPEAVPARRPATVGLVVFGAGMLLLFVSKGHQPLLVIAGVLLSLVGLIVIAPLGLRGLSRLSRRAPVSARLALRDLVRYESRSAGALRAITLAVAISATLAIAAAREAGINASAVPNLANTQLMIYVSPQGLGGPSPVLDAAQLQAADAATSRIAQDVGASDTVALEQAVNLNQPMPGGGGPGVRGSNSVQAVPASGSPAGTSADDVYPSASLVQVQNGSHGGVAILEESPLYVATPSVLGHFGLASPAPGAQVLTSDRQVSGLQIGYGNRGETATPAFQFVDLPNYTSAPNSLITESEAQSLGLTDEPAAWLVETPTALTSAQISAARRDAAAGGLVVESEASRISLVAVGNGMTIGGILLALAVLAMTVGLIRSETARDIRTLTATGASPMTRRSLTALTAGALALLGAATGLAGAYAGQLTWFHSQLSTMGHVPWFDLGLLLIGLPAVAFAGGLAFAGRQPSGVGRQPLD